MLRQFIPPVLRLASVRTLLAAVVLAGAAPTRLVGQCNCASASLIGDQVNTKLMNFANSVNSTVASPAVELPGAGPALLGAGQPPRWNIDFGANSIRIDFIQQPASYGAGIYFNFTSLDPKLPSGCPAAHIVGIQVTTNKAAANSIVAGATFTGNSVMVPFAGPSGTIDWFPGEYILVTLTYGCDAQVPTDSVNPCCPPWGTSQLKKVLAYQGTGGIADPYRLNFQSTTAINNALKAYVAYLNSTNSAITSINIQFSLWDAGVGATPSTTAVAMGATFTRSWTSGTGPVPALPNFFPNLLQINHWYVVRTLVSLNGGLTFFPESCTRTEIAVRLQVIP